jgi:hypothetical protein
MAASLSRLAPFSAAAEPASASLVRALVLALVAGAAIGGFVVGGQGASVDAVAEAGPELTRLLRGMALLKCLLGAGALAGVLFRLGAPISRARLALYALGCVAMACGPGLIWRMDLVRTGAFLLHAGLLVVVVMLFRDPPSAGCSRSASPRGAAEGLRHAHPAHLASLRFVAALHRGVTTQRRRSAGRILGLARRDRLQRSR